MPARTTRRRGRPRSEAADRSILDAAYAVLAEAGYAGMTIEDVAARAGVGKATVYRRWRSKAALTLDALDRIPPIPDPDTGSLREDLCIWLGSLRRNLVETGPVLAALVGERVRDRELARLVDRWIGVQRRGLVTMIRRGISRGELPGSTDVDLAVDLLTGPIVGRVLFTGRPGPAGRIGPGVDVLLRGLESVS